VLASFRTVDAVVVFGQDTPLTELIKVVRPRVMVMGNECRPEEAAGADLLRSWGGELLLLCLVPGQSTTRTVQQLSSTP
jgi:D-beta-D-heptose 7-phosphate kinase/D-beta-D-heptose 1-phosphate adenosyltransferase